MLQWMPMMQEVEEQTQLLRAEMIEDDTLLHGADAVDTSKDIMRSSSNLLLAYPRELHDRTQNWPHHQTCLMRVSVCVRVRWGAWEL